MFKKKDNKENKKVEPKVTIKKEQRIIDGQIVEHTYTIDRKRGYGCYGGYVILNIDEFNELKDKLLNNTIQTEVRVQNNITL